MNVSRGLFRAWVLISILWIVGASIIAYGIISPDTVKGSFQPAGKTKGGVDPWKIDYSKPFYETMLSPSAEKLSVTFFPVEWQYKSDWDKDTNLAFEDFHGRQKRRCAPLSGVKRTSFREKPHQEMSSYDPKRTLGWRDLA